jgi:hypothetical protein
MNINNNNNNRGPIHNGGINPANPNALEGKQKNALKNLCKILVILGNKIEDEQKLTLSNLGKSLEGISDKKLSSYLKRILNE